MNLSARVQLFKHVSASDKVIFTRHLAVMLKSGITMAEALDSIATQTKNPYFKKVINKVMADVLNGQSLEKGLSKFPKAFNKFYTYLIRVGEESGKLEENLKYLSEELTKESEFRKKILSASLYPMIIIITAIVVSGGISIFVLPQLIELFKSLDTNLPLSTKILLWIAETMKSYGISIFAGIFLLFILFRLLLRVVSFRYVWQSFLLSTPIFGKFVQYIQMTQICRNLGIMLSSGLPISSAFEIQEDATDNLVYKKYLKILREGILKGSSLKDVLSKRKLSYFPAIASEMIGIGEKTGKLDESFTYLGDFFENEVDDVAKNLSSTLEPVLLLVVGLIVAFIAIAIVSPIYQFTGSIKR